MPVRVLVFAKPPLPGRTKTRLAATVGPEAAADMARDLLADAWAAATSTPGVRVVLATPDPLHDHGLGRIEAWNQGGGDLGDRLERMVSRALAESGIALAVGADTVGLTPDRFRGVIDALGAAEAALAPSDDGGFWALALRRCPRGLLTRLPWSHPSTAQEVRKRLSATLGPLGEGPRAYDIDRVDDVRRLLRDAEGGVVAEGAAVRRARAWRAAGLV